MLEEWNADIYEKHVSNLIEFLLDRLTDRLSAKAKPASRR
jgi:hypothetical protein